MKKLVKIVLLAPVIIIAAAGCDQGSPVEPAESLLVVQAYLYAGKPVDDIRLTSTLSLSAEDSLAPTVHDADVVLWKQGNSYGLIASSGDSGYYHYPGNDLDVNSGDDFSIEILYNGQTVYAETSVPELPDNAALSSGTLYVPGDINPFDTDWDPEDYSIDLTWSNEDSSLFYVDVQCVEDNPEEISTWMGGIGRPQGMITAPRVNDSYTMSFRDVAFLGNHTITLFRVNREYADLYTSRQQDSRDLNEPLSNIEGGLGVFSAFAGKTFQVNVVEK